MQALCSEYRPPTGAYDEMCAPDGAIREHWDYLAEVLQGMGPEGMRGRWREARRLIRDNGVTYNLHADHEGMSRPWELDLIPLLLRSEEWADIERGLVQRAELLNAIMLDLYGQRRLLKNGLLPASLIFKPNSLLLPCSGIKVPGDRPLVFYSADLARTADGGMQVVSDGTQSPVGAGYALENRLVLSRVMPSLFRDSHVHRLAGFFRNMRGTLRNLAPKGRDTLRVVLLTPGPHNAAYFEHAYLANYLGYTLAQGDDLTVRDGALWLKTLKGLERVDVVMRRVNDYSCDPLELDGGSLLGVPGLLQAVRAGNVTMANALGSGILEHPALPAFLPVLCRELLGEELLLPSVDTWWCGDSKSLQQVLSDLPGMVIREMGGAGRTDPRFCGEMSKQELEDLRAAIKADPSRFVGQAHIPASTAPILDQDRIAPRAAILRSFLVAEEEGYGVMPGGLTRVAPEPGSLVICNRLGGMGKDTWVLATEPERDESLIPAGDSMLTERSASEVSSRVADNLFWIGRYAERAEGLVRLLRGIVLRSGERFGGGREFEQVRCLRLLLQTLTHQTLTYPGFVEEGAEARLAQPDPELLSLLTDAKRMGGLPQTLQALGMAAWSVRDRLSMDTWRVVNAIDEQLRALVNSSTSQLEEALDELDPLITALVAFSGLTRENMTHNDGWHFLEIGRRLERAGNTNILLKTLVSDSGQLTEAMLAESILGITDSLIIYRRRYQSGTKVGALLDLILQDECNPRSLVFQLVQIQNLIDELPGVSQSGVRTRLQKLILEAVTSVRLGDIDKLTRLKPGDMQRDVLAVMLEQLSEILPLVSDEITALYFRHEDRPHSLLSRKAAAGGQR